METYRKIAFFALAGLVGFGGTELGEGLGIPGLGGFVTKAEARMGRPLTPGSVAGVARRTTRRVIRRGSIVHTIPASCHYGIYYGHPAYHCGGVYYQKSGSGYVIIYF